MGKIFSIMLFLLLGDAVFSTRLIGQTVIAQWSFEGVTTTNTGTTPVVSGGTAEADAGAQTAGTGFTEYHANASTVWSNPAGNGSQKSISSTYWGVGDYYQFQFTSLNYSELSFTWSQTGSNTGPRDFIVQYSIDGSSFVNASGTNSSYTVTNDAWVATSLKSASIRTIDLGSVPTLNNQVTVYIRLVNNSATSIGGGAIATGGSDRVDSVTVMAAAIFPVELSAFTCRLLRNVVELQWTTVTEVGNYGFEVERRSINDEQLTADNWKKIGFLDGAGTSNIPHNYSFTDNAAVPGTLKYRLKQIDRDGNFTYSEEVEVTVANSPGKMVLGQNYPNPFNPSTVISYQLAVNNNVTLKVYDILGKEVVTLVNERKEAGAYQITFDGSSLASGVYLYTLQAGSFHETKKLMLMK